MTDGPEIRGVVHQNLYLAGGEREVQALITVDAAGEAAAALPADAAEVIMIDRSGSMRHPAEKAIKATEAAGVAIDELRDGVWFAVVAGSEEARMLWPDEPVLARADPDTRSEAKRALRAMTVGGGTRIGQWLRLANRLLGQRPSAIRHAILLTDGHNEHETAELLDEAIAACENGFTCDCRGVGADWSAVELRRIAKALLGSVDVVASPDGLADDFRAMMSASMDKRVAEVALRLWTPTGARVRLVKQTAPNPVDLTERRAEVTDQVGHYPTGSWGTEQRDFHISIEVPPGELGQERLAGRLSFVALPPDGDPRPLPQQFLRTRPDGSRQTHPEAMVSAIWTDDIAKSTLLNPQVAHATGRGAVEGAVRKAMEAYREGDSDQASHFLADARRWAAEVGDATMAEHIDELLDPETGTFRLDRMTPERELEIEMETDRQLPQHRADDWPDDGPDTVRGQPDSERSLP
ncbi:vWA domain-containing protein [Pseudonocardia acaciae]|uniref:vWA domain-containing protein n=1 Tax=Pseudonocardia acaciae TaxID=551276 RepID=UPI000684F174|nr:vWA domain-containing protein [Pseudonocardia acaciae]